MGALNGRMIWPEQHTSSDMLLPVIAVIDMLWGAAYIARTRTLARKLFLPLFARFRIMRGETRKQVVCCSKGGTL